MLILPKCSPEHAQRVRESGLDFGHSLLEQFIKEAPTEHALTDAVLVLEQAAVTLLAMHMANIVMQKRGTAEEYKEYMLQQLDRTYGELKKEELAAFAAGGEEICSKGEVLN